MYCHLVIYSQLVRHVLYNFGFYFFFKFIERAGVFEIFWGISRSVKNAQIGSFSDPCFPCSD